MPDYAKIFEITSPRIITPMRILCGEEEPAEIPPEVTIQSATLFNKYAHPATPQG